MIEWQFRQADMRTLLIRLTEGWGWHYVHSLAAADFAHSVDLIERHGWQLLNQGYAGRMEAWMNALPAQWRAVSPRTNLDFAWMHLLRSHFG